MSKVRYLTKSRYKLALECPSKLFYAEKPQEYLDGSVDDPFLKALARGGFQIGALAKLYFPDGVEVAAKSHDQAVIETQALLAQENVTIFEAAVRAGNLFVRIDVLVKTGNKVRLIEVKSKSIDSEEENPFFDKRLLKSQRVKINQDYAKYIYDVAFQTHVFKLAHPNMQVSSRLMLADTAKLATVDGLNQLFLLREGDDGRTTVIVKAGTTAARLGERVLSEINLDEAVAAIFADKDEGRSATERCQGLSFADEIAYFAEMYAADRRIVATPGKHCKKCQFRVKPEHGLKSGFNECWVVDAKVKEEELEQPFVFDVWKFGRADDLVDAKKYFIRDMDIDDIKPKDNPKEAGLSQSQRQWLQVQLTQKGTQLPFLDVAGLKAAMNAWTFPLHFIDFETMMVAVPMNAGRRPYEQMAFQFSHHVVHQDGRIEHRDQYLHDVPGAFPNFEFLEALEKSLNTDDGTIFRYSHHENTVLCQIYEQLKVSEEPRRAELMNWIQTITKSGSSSSDTWVGRRNMVDLCELVMRFYYHPYTRGSNSIKYVLPAILRDSSALQARFGQPIYGGEGKDAIKSLNYRNWTWIQWEGSQIIDPYRLLPKVYKNFPAEDLDQVMCHDELADGGAAMTAYAMMQFTEMSAAERRALRESLLLYCELDTLAMVMLYEYWCEFVQGRRVPTAA